MTSAGMSSQLKEILKMFYSYISSVFLPGILIAKLPSILAKVPGLYLNSGLQLYGVKDVLFVCRKDSARVVFKMTSRQFHASMLRG